MKHLFLTVVLALISTAAQATDSLVFGGGAKGGVYADKTKKLMRLYGGNSKYVKTKGANDNYKRLLLPKDHPDAIDVAPISHDLLALKAMTQPSHIGKVELVGTYTPECVFLVTRDERISLSDPNVRVAIGKMGSGSEVTWRLMRSLNPKLKGSKMVFSGGPRTLARLRITGKRGVDAFVFVQAPDLDRGILAKVLKSRKEYGLKLYDLYTRPYLKVIPKLGEKVYEKQSIRLTSEWKLFENNSISTICTQTIVAARSELSDEAIENLSTVLYEYEDVINP